MTPVETKRSERLGELAYRMPDWWVQTTGLIPRYILTAFHMLSNMYINS